jgi:hypothetical protein
MKMMVSGGIVPHILVCFVTSFVVYLRLQVDEVASRYVRGLFHEADVVTDNIEPCNV